MMVLLKMKFYLFDFWKIILLNFIKRDSMSAFSTAFPKVINGLFLKLFQLLIFFFFLPVILPFLIIDQFLFDWHFIF